MTVTGLETFVCTVQHSTVQYSTVQYSTVQCSSVQYSAVQYSTVQYSTVHTFWGRRDWPGEICVCSTVQRLQVWPH
jgi:hypothetical protein